MKNNPTIWVRVLLGLFDVWVVSDFKSRFVFGLSSVNVGFWVWLDLISSSMHLLWINWLLGSGSAPLVTTKPRLSEQEAQLMLTTGSTRLAVSRGQQTWYHSTCNI